jgi:glycosyltransferase involved in cell wall biosynthesis
LRVLTMTTLFPSAVDPRHGIFVETRLRKLCASAPVDVHVVAPVPWFPFSWPLAGRYATYAATPRRERRFGLDVRHPRFLAIPRAGMSQRPASVCNAAARAAADLSSEGWRCDVIDAHYLYPDGVAAAMLSRRLRRPFVVTARGSDVNLIAQMPGPQARILAAIQQSSRVIAVSQALKEALVRIGVPEERTEVLRNGVDLTVFRPTLRDATRASLGVGTASLIVSVGNLVPEKGHDLVLRAAARIERAHVVIVGRGPDRSELHALADRLRISGRVRFLENMPQTELASIYSAADVLALGSSREGWPNVILEAMACGTPVVSTDVGGVGEMVTAPVVGLLVSGRDEADYADALVQVLAHCRDRAGIRAHASQFGWEPVVQRYHEILATAARSGSN